MRRRLEAASNQHLSKVADHNFLLLNTASQLRPKDLKKISSIVWVAIALVASAPLLSAQDEEARQGKHHKLSEWLRAFSPEEQAKLRAAHKQALENPDVRAADERRKQANADYHDQLHREMLRIDPSLKPLLDKLSDLRRHNERADY